MHTWVSWWNYAISRGIVIFEAELGRSRCLHFGGWILTAQGLSLPSSFPVAWPRYPTCQSWKQSQSCWEPSWLTSRCFYSERFAAFYDLNDFCFEYVVATNPRYMTMVNERCSLKISNGIPEGLPNHHSLVVQLIGDKKKTFGNSWKKIRIAT